MHLRPLRTLLAAALALAAAPVCAQTFSQTVFIGDSLTDSGAFRPALIQVLGPNGAAIGRFTTNPGLVWSEHVADYYGTGASPANQGGTNYAVGGARVGVNGASPFGPIPSLQAQVTAYLQANGGRADPNALFTVWGGANDLFAASADPANAQAIVGGAVVAQIGVVGALTNAGAQYILVPTIPDIGLTPDARDGGPAAMAGGTQLATLYNTNLFNGLAAQGLRVIPVDTFHFLQEVVANPGLYGFTNVTDRACNTQPAPAGASSLFCNPASWATPNAPDTYLFADGVHPSTAAHKIIGQLVVSVIEAPRQVALLPRSAAMVGRARTDMVALQLANGTEGDGMRWWGDVRADSQRYDKGGAGDGFDGGGPTLSVGVDWTSGAFTYGFFGGYGRQDIDWGRRRGDFRQTDAGIGAYAGWSNGKAWGNAQLGYTRLDYDTDRDVTLGAATRTHHGSTKGDNLSFAASGGWNFGHGKLTHGPVVSVVAQRIGVDGFAEDAPALSTSLAYPDQDYDSLIGSAGWQARYAITENVQPFARLTWDREFEDAPEHAFARSQSIPGSLEYAVPGPAFDDTYGTLALGARAKVFGLDLLAGGTASVGQKGGNDASVFVTVSGHF